MTNMQQPVPASGGRYGQGQVWRRGPAGARKAAAAAEPATASLSTEESAKTAPAADNPDARFALPADIYWLQGHDGQSIAIVPSKQLVVVRLGLTPRALDYQPQSLVAAVVKALE